MLVDNGDIACAIEPFGEELNVIYSLRKYKNLSIDKSERLYLVSPYMLKSFVLLINNPLRIVNSTETRAGSKFPHSISSQWTITKITDDGELSGKAQKSDWKN